MEEGLAARDADAVVQTRLMLPIDPVQKAIEVNRIGMRLKISLAGIGLDRAGFRCNPGMSAVTVMAAQITKGKPHENLTCTTVSALALNGREQLDQFGGRSVGCWRQEWGEEFRIAIINVSDTSETRARASLNCSAESFAQGEAYPPRSMNPGLIRV